MKIADFLTLLKGVRKSGDGWAGLCPAHQDRRNSLSAREGDDERILVKCHRGCSYEQITAALNLRPGDLFPDESRPGVNGQSRRREIYAYDYRDERGELLYQVVRFEPKDFRCRRPDGRGGSTWNLDGVRIVPYRLHELAEARRVYIPEGEKDCDALAALGLLATTNHGGAGKWRQEHTAALGAAAVPELVILPDHDPAGEAHARAVARSCLAAGLAVKIIRLPDLPPKGDVGDWLAQGHAAAELEALADAAVPLTPADVADLGSADVAGPELRREGFDLVLTWPDGVSFALTAIRDSREGVRGELTVTQGAQRLSWGSFALSSTQARETLRKKLEATAPGPPWGEYLEETAFRLTQAARQGEPIVTLTGTVTSPTRELLPGLLYEGEPTVIYGDGDTGKSLVALTVAIAMHAGAALPFGLTPARAVPAAYLDWETNRDTQEERLAFIAAGLGINPPAILYKRMSRPLVDEAAGLAAEFARRGIGLVVIDSKMFAVAVGDGAAFHEPITAFYNALRLFAPAASLVLNHITNDAAKSGGPARPFGGAFAFNGPRLHWEAKRDQDVTDATAIAFTCRKANNLPQKPDPFGLRFVPGEGTITVYPFDLAEAAPQTVAGASLPYKVRLALATENRTISELAEHLNVSQDNMGRVVRRLVNKGELKKVGESAGRGTPSTKWGLAARE